MRTSYLLAAALTLFGGAHADDDSTTTVGYFIPNWSATYLEYGGWTSTGASVAGINAVKTTYKVGCLKDAPKTDCNMKDAYTIIQGPDTISLSQVYTASTSDKSTSYDVTVTRSYECSLKSWTESASCTMSVGMSGSDNGGTYASSSSTKSTYESPTSSYYYLVVTGGVKSFTEPAATKTPDAAAGLAAPVAAMITAAPVAAAAVVAAAWA
ncbi:hypothetical protein CBS63078_7556 [Aspergillus niger]|uniref:Uncharacterized protein n=3 Tax=Aspergillus TaxID=5052 RepID=A0A3F3PPX0_9EURO|nr:uncharacterized protein BO96DRAFT_131612 [Aspergillus niger CBS 101883]XP_026622009.1 hypothetical protein BDQ94DRAFT_151160 [Aspergillus welwitschiae]KAI2838210.1 hypothetical protein CBS11350_8270 [Aspergillus niger]RDK45895.1 hypothetical protein M752DRAFT_124648 [Aspergillus phoenicis ATCC 13157]KAI2877972.1 hypothetical protein CBS13152_9303 [Aspergillus niger]KAI2885234.1 hypothetical protein CBS11852_8368 [Aspergillus niger]KAI2898555.1 hypothetical protein CBS63078_7556 [Aspergillu